MKNGVRLVEPSLEYRAGFENMVNEYRDLSDEESQGWFKFYKEALVDFEKFVQELKDHAEGKNLPEGWVRCYTGWLVDENKKVIGVTRIRLSLENDYLKRCGGHIGYDITPSERKKGYGTLLLKLSLEKSKELDLRKVLVTCDYDNEGSKKVIENNGGIFEGEVWDERDDTMVRRYWFNCE